MAHNFLPTILKTGFVPRIIRADPGTENHCLDRIQQALRYYHDEEFAGEHGYIVGPSSLMCESNDAGGSYELMLQDITSTFLKY